MDHGLVHRFVVAANSISNHGKNIFYWRCSFVNLFGIATVDHLLEHKEVTGGLCEIRGTSDVILLFVRFDWNDWELRWD